LPILLWILTFLALVVALTTLGRARRLSKRVDRLTESYWDLRYQVGQLQARLNRLDAGEPDSPPPTPGRADAFIPVSSLKR